MGGHSKSVTSLHTKLWDLFSIYIRYRDSEEIEGVRVGRCISCGKQINAFGPKCGQAGHYIKRRHKAVLYDEQNVNLQCPHCNSKPPIGLDGNMAEYAIGLEEKYGTGTARALTIKGREIKHWTIA